MNTILLLGHILFYTNISAGPANVYICSSKYAKKYHYSSTCRGLSNCQYKILKTTILIAKNKGMTLCGWENKEKK